MLPPSPDPLEPIRQALKAQQWETTLESVWQALEQGGKGSRPLVWHEFIREARLLSHACVAAIQRDTDALLCRWDTILQALQPALIAQVGERYVTHAEDLLMAARLARAARQGHLDALLACVGFEGGVDALIEAHSQRTGLPLTEARCMAAALPAVHLLDTLLHLPPPACRLPQARLAFISECARGFLSAPRQVVGSAVIPVAHIEGTQGFVDETLLVEVLTPGTGQVFHHPDDVFHTRPDSLFETALQHAFHTACHVAGRQGLDGCWRLHRGGQPTEMAYGSSASGQAGRGFYCALTGKVLDEGVVVLAQVHGNGQLGTVEGVPAKTLALATASKVDTLVVANDRDRHETVAVLEAGGAGARVRVVVAETAAAAYELRSQLAEEVQAYLEHLTRRMAELPRYYPAHLRTDATGETGFDAIRQMVQLVEDRTAFEQWRAAERERVHAAGLDVDRLVYAPTRARPESEEPETSDAIPQAALMSVPWDDAAGVRFRRAIILGDPGCGKTWLLRYEARRLAREALRQLQEQVCRPADLHVPIVVRLSEVNQRDDALEEALVVLVSMGRSEGFRRYVQTQITTHRCTILLDGWDEVSEEIPAFGQPITYQPYSRQRLEQRLEAFARQFPHLRMLLTSRIVGYTSSPLPGAQELELLAFDPAHVEVFVRVWFGATLETAAQFLAMLEQHPQVRGLARIPLMLSLMCRAYHEKHLDFPARRVALYERCLRGLLRDWKEEKERREISASYVEAMLECLRVVGYTLFAEGCEQFSESRVRTALVPWLHRLPLQHELYGRNAAVLIAQLKRDGILITAGEYRDGPLLFLHRTFHEYLAASALAQQENWRAIALAHVYDPAWQEVLRLLGGVLGEHTRAYIAALLRENAHDLLCRPLGHAVRVIVEAPPGQVPLALSESLLEQVLALYLAPPAWTSHALWLPLVTYWGESAVPHLALWLQHETPAIRKAVIVALGQTGSAAAVPELLPLLAEEDQGIREAAIVALGQLRAAAAVPHLLPLLEEEDSGIREAAIVALRRLGPAATVPALVRQLHTRAPRARQLTAVALERQTRQAAAALRRRLATAAVPYLLRPPNTKAADGRRAVVAALGQLGAVDAVPHLLLLLQEADPALRRTAIVALGQTGVATAGLHLLPLLQEADPALRAAAAMALGQLRVPDTVPHLLPLLQDPGIRRAVVAALGQLGAVDAVPHLLPLLQEADPALRRTVVEALGQLRAVDAVPLLLRQLKGKNLQMLRAVIPVLGQLGAVAAVPLLLRRLHAKDRVLRRPAVEALGQLRAIDAVPHLLPLLEDADPDLRWAAMIALSQLRRAAAVPHLLRLLATDLSPAVCQEVVVVLGQLARQHKLEAPIGKAPQFVQDGMQRLARELEALIGKQDS